MENVQHNVSAINHITPVINILEKTVFNNKI